MWQSRPVAASIVVSSLPASRHRGTANGSSHGFHAKTVQVGTVKATLVANVFRLLWFLEEVTMDVKYGLIEVGWTGGLLHLQYTAVPSVDKAAIDAVREVMQSFTNECQMMLIWYAGVLQSREPILRHLNATDPNQPITIPGAYPDGHPFTWARASRDDVIDAFSKDGSFERLYGKSFVVFVYQTWEGFARPRIAAALNVPVKHVKCDFMGDWRLLRNWIVHQSRDAEQQYFSRAERLSQMLPLQSGAPPEITGDMVFTLMAGLNSLEMDVNPQSRAPAFKKVPIPPEMAEAIARDAEAEGLVVLDIPSLRPIWPRPSDPK